MANPFDVPKLRITSAHAQIEDLKTVLRGYVDSHPYARVVEPDVNGIDQVHKIKFTRPIPGPAINHAFQIGEALRAALDGAGFASAQASGNTRLKDTYFPIADTKEKLATDVIGRGRCKDLPPQILALFEGFNPYKTGNPPIWGVNQLANGTKHRILVPIGFEIGDTFARTFHSPGGTIRFGMPFEWNSDRDELEIGSFAPDNKVTYDFQFGYTVELREIKGVRFGQAPTALRTMTREVERIVLATEAECRRLGFVT